MYLHESCFATIQKVWKVIWIKLNLIIMQKSLGRNFKFETIWIAYQCYNILDLGWMQKMKFHHVLSLMHLWNLLKMHPLLQHFLQYFGKGRSLERFGCFQICKGHDVLNHKDDDVQDSEGRWGVIEYRYLFCVIESHLTLKPAPEERHNGTALSWLLMTTVSLSFEL